MGSPYDFFGARAHPAKEVELWNKGQLNGEQWANRLALRQRDGSWTSMTRTRPSQPVCSMHERTIPCFPRSPSSSSSFGHSEW